MNVAKPLSLLEIAWLKKIYEVTRISEKRREKQLFENIENDCNFHFEDEISPVHVLLLTPNVENGKDRHDYNE